MTFPGVKFVTKKKKQFRLSSRGNALYGVALLLDFLENHPGYTLQTPSPPGTITICSNGHWYVLLILLKVWN